MHQNVHLLLIEDDPAVGSSLRTGLEREGYHVGWCKSGQAGLTYTAQHNPQLIILDVRLPDGSGFDLCRQLRQQKHHQPLLMLTARREETDKVLGLEMGADDYMTKPFALRELLSRVRALLRRAYGEFAAASQHLLTIHDIQLDLESGIATQGSVPLSLTPTEQRLLIYLAKNAGQALSRSQILENVWGYDAAVESERTVNVHIRRLREKIEPHPSQPTRILTVPGIGYRLTKSA